MLSRRFAVVATRDSSPGGGGQAAHAWMRALGLNPPPGSLRWHAEISIDVIDGPARIDFDERIDSRFHIDLYSEEWGFFFCHAGKVSWIRVTDIAFVHGRDDHQLVTQVPAIDDIGALMRKLEAEHGVRFNREHAIIRTNIVTAEPAIRRWLVGL